MKEKPASRSKCVDDDVIAPRIGRFVRYNTKYQSSTVVWNTKSNHETDDDIGSDLMASGRHTFPSSNH